MRDHVRHRRGARLDATVGDEQIVERGIPLPLLDRPQSFRRRAQKHVAPRTVARHQPRRRLAHRVEPLEPQLQAQREFFGRGFEIGSPGNSRPDLR